MDSAKIKELIELVSKSGITGLIVEDGGCKVEIRKDQPAPIRPAGQPAAAPASIPASPPQEPGDTAGLAPLKAPMTGTFYVSSSPADKPFVEAGGQVNKGQTVCIIEAMKTFNEIEADSSGTIEKILVSNGQVVELGQPLFLLRA